MTATNIFFLKKRDILFLTVCERTCVHLIHMRVGAPRPEALRVPGAVIPGGYNLPASRWWKLTACPLREQRVL